MATPAAVTGQDVPFAGAVDKPRGAEPETLVSLQSVPFNLVSWETGTATPRRTQQSQPKSTSGTTRSDTLLVVPTRGHPPTDWRRAGKDAVLGGLPAFQNFADSPVVFQWPTNSDMDIIERSLGVPLHTQPNSPRRLPVCHHPLTPPSD